MLRICPHCHQSTQHFLCPRCGVRTDDAEMPLPASRALAETADELTPWNGVFAGLLLAQGLYYALRHLVSAALLWSGDAGADVEFWASPNGQAVQQVTQAVALFVGSTVAGAGQSYALAIGAAVGVVNAVLIISLQALVGQLPDEMTLYVQPLLHALLGAVGGAIGGRIWRPVPGLPVLPAGPNPEQKHLTTQLPDQPYEVLYEPLPWVRMLLGAAVAVGGTLGAPFIRDLVLSLTGGSVGPEIQRSPFIPWEIAAVAQLIGGGIAGMNTRGGGKYGFGVGLLAAGLLALVLALTGLRLYAHEFLAWLLGLGVPDGSPAVFVVQSVQVVLVAAFGGWLGSHTMPVIPPKRSLDGGAR
jgi:hypothetical protein